jgi:hypothetical protein
MFLLRQELPPIVGIHFQDPSISLDRMGERDRIGWYKSLLLTLERKISEEHSE